MSKLSPVGKKKYVEQKDVQSHESILVHNNLLYAEKTEREIWVDFKKGNKSAFIHIYNTYFDLLYNYARQFTGDLDLIKDAIQDVFVRLNESRERLSDTGSIKFYLFKSIKREVIYALKQQRYSKVQLANMKGLGFEYEVSFEQALINRQIDEETIKKIQDAANNLNDRQREIIFYHFFEGLSIKQIKELMNFSSIQASYNLLNRALSHLKEVLGILIILFLPNI